MDKINWSGHEWILQERWGKVHPEKPKAWYDKSAVDTRYCPIIECEQLILKTHKNPKYFKKLDVEPQIGVGLISSTEKFGYGYYEIEAKLPSGPNLWPAFWMWAWDSWPPEIDVFEGYSNDNGSYFNWNIDALIGNLFKVQTNVHLGKTPNNYNLGAKNHWLGWKSPNKKFNKYSLYWTDKEITILFNEKIARRITDESVLEQVRGKKMNVIINNMVTTSVDSDNPPYSEFIVNYFNYIPIKIK